MRFPDRPRPRRRGYTLLESLMAASILLVIVIAVTSAVLAGQQNALEAQHRIVGALAAEELMGRLTTTPYTQLPTWNGFREEVGDMTDLDGGALPLSYQGIGRDVTVTLMTHKLKDLSITIQGREISVRSFDVNGRVLVELITFVAKPTP